MGKFNKENHYTKFCVAHNKMSLFLERRAFNSQNFRKIKEQWPIVSMGIQILAGEIKNQTEANNRDDHKD